MYQELLVGRSQARFMTEHCLFFQHRERFESFHLILHANLGRPPGHLGTVMGCIMAFGVVLQRYTMFALCPGHRRRLGANPGTVIDCIMAFCAVLQRYTMCDLFPGALGRPRGASGYSDCITAFGVVLQRCTMFALFPGLRRRLGAHLGTVVDCIMAFCAVLQRYTMCDLFPGALGRPRGASGYSD